MNSSDIWLQNAQSFEDYEDVVEFPISTGQDGKEKVRKKTQKNKMEQQKKLQASSSYVITKAPKRALKRIKIEIFDISGGQTSSSSTSEDSVVSAQYIVSEVVDEILDKSEKLVNEICKKLSSDSYYNL
ncbi:hypothetical protein JYU34_013224 [Plutella xylostella]|uniref:Uncharacterized protein n=1 Tax=Plutella xylostella TaxID=51655 RepID=A0ABQ7Q9C4_PLUXY|nr:hypothetical protein JYU34_013224 [Plutella xylostella]